MTFANALRSILRQDPDIIMIGEIRDLETLEIAIKAALTGHLVLSTLHTNDAVSSIQRMIDMGADAFMVAAALIGAEAQRLVKTICPYCKTKHKPEDIYLDPIRNLIPKDAVFYKGRGCEHCNFTGYGGRTLISEIFLNDERLESMISKEKEKIEILNYLRSNGYQTMFYDGLIKALKGLITLEDVYKVAKL
jgi:type II secretory ATPase GspE/PulE/Tfp pilus assembly ATPase PilB-like protein